MAILQILHYPDARLKIPAKPVRLVDDGVRKLVDEMAATMYAAPGIGLAATQVDVHKRVIVIDVSENRDQLLVLINPVITAATGEQEREEGCLSVPGIFDRVARAESVRLEATNRLGERFSMQAEGLLAVCIQHEIDHLEGRVFVEYLSQLKQTRIRAKLRKVVRKTA
jgi:peptide deformylase